MLINGQRCHINFSVNSVRKAAVWLSDGRYSFSFFYYTTILSPVGCMTST